MRTDSNIYAKEYATTTKLTTGDWYIIPASVESITAILDATSATAKIQVTNDRAALLAATTPAGILDDDINGTVTNAVVGVSLRGVAGVRMVITSGSPTLSINIA